MAFKTIHANLLKVSHGAAVVGGLGIIFISCMITVDVFLRKFFGTTLGGASEIAGMIFAVATAMAYPYVLLDRAHIRIDVLYSRIPVKARAFLDLAAMLIMLTFYYQLTMSTFQLLTKSWNGGSRSVGVVQVPLWMPQSLWVLGFALFTLTALFLTVFAVYGIVRRNWSMVTSVAGVPSIEETIEEETHIEADAEELSSSEAVERKNEEPK